MGKLEGSIKRKMTSKVEDAMRKKRTRLEDEAPMEGLKVVQSARVEEGLEVTINIHLGSRSNCIYYVYKVICLCC